MLTISDFNNINDGSVFSSEVVIDRPEGIVINNSGKSLRWVAKKGRIGDWALYIDSSEYSVHWIATYGQKIKDESIIRKILPCTDDVFKLYRY